LLLSLIISGTCLGEDFYLHHEIPLVKRLVKDIKGKLQCSDEKNR